MTRDAPAVVLDAALALLTEADGRLTYGAVAQRAGVSRQTVYSHFPTRPQLLVAAVERARAQAGGEAGARSVYEAPTAVSALHALLAFHARFVPPMLPAYVAVERERSLDPDVDAAFRQRVEGRRALAHHVAIRLEAEGVLRGPWTPTTAGDLVATLLSGTSTAAFLHDAGWSVEELHERLLAVLLRTLLTDPAPPTTREEP